MQNVQSIEASNAGSCCTTKGLLREAILCQNQSAASTECLCIPSIDIQGAQIPYVASMNVLCTTSPLLPTNIGTYSPSWALQGCT